MVSPAYSTGRDCRERVTYSLVDCSVSATRGGPSIGYVRSPYPYVMTAVKRVITPRDAPRHEPRNLTPRVIRRSWCQG
jgi:hypothetical protein